VVIVPFQAFANSSRGSVVETRATVFHFCSTVFHF